MAKSPCHDQSSDRGNLLNGCLDEYWNPLFFKPRRDGRRARRGIPKGDGIKGNHTLPMGGPANARPQVPIVMGRSVSAHHKTTLHHVKMQPLESLEIPVAADNSR